MFFNCNTLSSIDTSKWDVSHVTDMASMFEGCSGLQYIKVSKWNVSNVTDMSFMFYGCSSLGEIDVSNWDVSKVTNFDHFAAHANLRRNGIENWKPISATNMNALFHNCAEEELDLSGWDVSKNQFFCQMFENSPNLKRIKGLDRWNTSAGLGFDGMFERCSKLEEVDLSSFNTTKAKNGTKASTNGHKTATLQNMFLSCNNLKKVKLGPNFSINGDGTNTTAGNKLVLPTPSTDYITGADGNWYAFNGDPYAPNAIQDKTAETYFASFPLCQNEDVIVKNGSLIDVAKAIKEKNGATAKYTPAQFGAAIRAL
jgi:surface protein